MAGQILVTLDVLDGHGAAVGNNAAAAEARFKSLHARLSRLRGAFQGDAADAFDRSFAQWSGSAAQLGEALQNLGSFLKQAAAIVEETDARLAAGLGGGAGAGRAAGRVRATPDGLRTTAAHLRSEHQELNDKVDSVNTDVGTFEEAFQGRASTQFSENLGDWYQAVTGSMGTLEALIGFLETTADAMQQTDSGLGQMVGQMAIPGAAVAGAVGGGAVGGAVGSRRPRTSMRPPGYMPPPPSRSDPEVIRTHLADLRRQHEYLMNRRDLVARRIDWSRSEVAEGHTRLHDLRELRMTAIATGASPDVIARIDEQIGVQTVEIEEAEARHARLVDRLDDIDVRLDQIVDDHDALADQVGADPLGPEPLRIDGPLPVDGIPSPVPVEVPESANPALNVRPLGGTS